jgi:hypothetical protein
MLTAKTDHSPCPAGKEGIHHKTKRCLKTAAQKIITTPRLEEFFEEA